ncbi:hypothetical protein [Ohtaekwangia koreensis]|uniref:Uncharacterized protein n=1 Tax=Ohtaekwangia koreensis TaxID=688867 RepID=A0A1T5J7P9_9BACT|nr:hypothetical protein [Ohtaekwangia koreensis]SKC47346.1 hypothetical protein SAMN05660236_0838 [Ohtaekwangia koreensis]
MRRKKQKRKSRRSRKQGGLQGITQSVSGSKLWGTTKEGVFQIVAAFGGVILGAAVGKHSLLLGIPVTVAGRYINNDYIAAAGLGMTVSNGFQNATKPLSGADGVDGFDMKQIAQDAKDRVGKFFDNFKEKLYIPATDASSGEATNGLGEGDNVRYFVNPMNAKELDLSELDRIEQQVIAMNKGTSGLDDIDREF